MAEILRSVRQNETRLSVMFGEDESGPIKDIEVFSCSVKDYGFTDDARVYAEGYQMLHHSPTKLADLLPDTGTMDKDHYKLPQTQGCYTAYNYILFGQHGKVLLLGATSCHRFRSELRVCGDTIKLVQCLEGLLPQPGTQLSLESFAVIQGENRDEVLKEFAGYINANHPPRGFREVPDGWCSWYCYGPLITEAAIYRNLECAKRRFPALKYIQIDDGYQPHMGDWLEQTKKFRSPMKEICLHIKQAGFEPAMWVAPFIASAKSRVFHDNPDWFIKDTNGAPLNAADVTFRGWRDAPWYFLDPTHPDARVYIQSVFRIMKHEWKVDYFKLDANSWGALDFGLRFCKDVTSVEAYRIGMEALWEVCGEDTFLLGCNAPLWPSLGVVNGMRVTDDINRHADTVKSLSMQCFQRNWMHGRLWINDPDCLVQVDTKTGVLAGFFAKAKPIHKRKENEAMYRYAAAYIRASGGMVLSGDRLYALSEYDSGILNKLLASERTAATFNSDYSVGTIRTATDTEYLLFNSDKMPRVFIVEDTGTFIDMFTGRETAADALLTVTVGGNDAVWMKKTHRREAEQ